jgi:hypothetical protein
MAYARVTRRSAPSTQSGGFLATLPRREGNEGRQQAQQFGRLENVLQGASTPIISATRK